MAWPKAGGLVERHVFATRGRRVRSPTHIASFVRAKPKTASEPTAGSALLSVVKKEASPADVGSASRTISGAAPMPVARVVAAAIAIPRRGRRCPRHHPVHPLHVSDGRKTPRWTAIPQ